MQSTEERGTWRTVLLIFDRISSVQFSSVPRPIGSSGRHDRRFSRDRIQNCIRRIVWISSKPRGFAISNFFSSCKEFKSVPLSTDFLCSLHSHHHPTINPLTARVVGAPQMISQPVFFLFPVLHCPLGPAELQACPFPDVVFPPLPLSALPSSPFHCALQDGFGQTWWTGDLTIPLHFASLYDRQEVFVWSNCLLDLGTEGHPSQCPWKTNSLSTRVVVWTPCSIQLTQTYACSLTIFHRY